jgi:UDP-N-acetylglucosamine acyltransferase
MPSNHHETAVIHPGAVIGSGVSVGPYAIVEDQTVIGDGCSIGPHAVIASGTRMGRDNQVFAHAMLGFPPQDLSWDGSESFLEIGDRNVFREGTTLHRGSGQGTSTVIGSDCFLMALAHVGHNSRVGDRVILTNNVMLAGHVTVEDSAIIGGGAGIHQFARIGRLAMIGGNATIRKDIPPFMLAARDTTVFGLNLVGLRRNGVSRDSIHALQKALKLLYTEGFSVPGALEKLREWTDAPDEIRELATFIESSRRGIAREFGKQKE